MRVGDVYFIATMTKGIIKVSVVTRTVGIWPLSVFSEEIQILDESYL